MDPNALMNVNPRWSQPPDHPPGSPKPTETEMGRLVNGFAPTPCSEHSLWCSALDMADTDRRSLRVPSDRTSRKAANANPTNALKEENDD